MKLRDAILEKLDVREVLEETCGVTVFLDTGNDWKTHCPFHEDAVPSMAVHKTKGVFKCFGCDHQGSIFDLYGGYHNLSFRQSLEQLAEYYQISDDDLDKEPTTTATAVEEPEEAKPPISLDIVKKYHDDLMRKAIGEKNYLISKWGLTEHIIRRFGLGWDGERFTIPIMDEDGECVNIRRYLPEAKNSEDKMRNFIQIIDKEVYRYGSPMRLFPLSALSEDVVVLVEGEKDCIIATQRGINAITTTGGSGAWNKAWNPLFKDKKVYICYDSDAAGKRGAEKIAQELEPFAAVYIIELPKSEIKGYDLANFFIDDNATDKDFFQLMHDAPGYSRPFVAAPGIDAPIEVELSRATLAKYNGKPIITRAFVSGKDVAPFLVPIKLEVNCACPDVNEACSTCPRWRQNGVNTAIPYRREKYLNSNTPGILKLINCSDTQQKGYLKEIAWIDKKCDYGRVKILEHGNIQQIILIPELDSSTTSMLGEVEYVSRNAYYIGHDIVPNRGYVFVGTTQPEPKTQYATHVFDHKDDMQDSIRSFQMTPELFDALQIFQVAPGQTIQEKLEDLYNYFSLHVHRIHGRPELQLAFDLVWHSVLNFNFLGQPVRKGWLEGLVLGDTAQGKTELTARMRDYYNLGQRITGEKTSSAGLIGGLQKVGERWVLQWGVYPQNDRRAITIDEYSSLRTEEIANMTDIRSTGIAEIVKIRMEKTAARVRALLCSNLRSGEMLATLSHGIEGVRELMGKNEDIRRLDFAITVATGEVPTHIINMPVSAMPVPKENYSRDVCHALVLWAWSRNNHPNNGQVIFTNDAEQAILNHAELMGKKYHPSAPLVEPSDQRLKLARMATALAARLFSTEDGEHIMVKKEHVEHISTWLQEQYDKPSMRYDDWSEMAWNGDRFQPGAEKDIEDFILGMPNAEDIVSFLARQERKFRQADLENACALDRESIKKLIQILIRHSAIISDNGYKLQPNFINLLKKMKADMPFTKGSMPTHV